MTEHEVQIPLRQPGKLSAIGKDVTHIIMVVFYVGLLAWCLWITVKDVCSYLPGYRIRLKERYFFELSPPIRQDERKEPEIVCAKKLLKEIQGRSHGFRSFFLMKKPDHKAGILKGKGLDERPLLLVVNGIHFCCRDRRVGSNKLEIVRKPMAVIIHRLFALFKLFPFAHGYLPAKREVIYAKIFENPTLDVGIERFDGEAKFGMPRKDLIKGLTFKKEWGNGLSDQNAFGFRKIDTLPGIREMEEVSLVSLDGIVEVMVEAALADPVTMVAGTDRAVTKGTGLFDVGRAIFGAGSARFGTLLEIGTDDCGIKAVARLKGPVFFDFFSNRSRVFGNGMCNS